MSKFLGFLPFLRRRTRMQRAGDFFSNRIGAKRAGIGGGGLLAALAVPFLIRRLRARRAEQEFRPATA